MAHYKKYAKHRYLLMPLNLIFMELIIRAVAGCKFFGIGLPTMIVFSLLFGFLLTVLCSFGTEKVNRISLIVVQSLLSVWYCTQIIYHSFFDKFLIIYSLGAGGADQVIASGLVRNTVTTILSCWWAFIVLGLPVAAVVVYTHFFPMGKAVWRLNLTHAVTAILLYFAIIGIGLLIPGLKEVHKDAFNVDISVKTYGLFRTEMLDFRHNVLGIGSSDVIESGGIIGTDENDPAPAPENSPAHFTPKAQVMDIDFASLAESEENKKLASLHNYFANEKPSYTNEYTGMFEGYNLIQITAEGFSPYAIDKDFTPTLYKMQQEGFNFTNFYTPIWEVSTSDGEYAATLGMIPKSGVWSYYRSGENKVLFPFSMPQQFLNSGLDKVRAYHNHTYSYYHRDISHPNLGFDYKGLGNGLQGITKCWPESDVELVDATANDYMSDERFMTYYMSVSGHLEYSFAGNQMASKNKELTTGLPYSDTVRAYLACNKEFDLAMEKLLADLEAAGVADKTVIAITPDHYPYGLEDDKNDNKYHYFDEIAGHSIELPFELYKSCFLLYSPGMKEPVTVDKYCCAVDILPTLNNLFGFEFDSRLLIGRDILSDSDPLVIFLDRSWITDKGKYDAANHKFTLFPGQSVADEEAYVSSVKKVVSNKFKVSTEILESNYYAKVTGREHLYSK